MVRAHSGKVSPRIVSNPPDLRLGVGPARILVGQAFFSEISSGADGAAVEPVSDCILRRADDARLAIPSFAMTRKTHIWMCASILFTLSTAAVLIIQSDLKDHSQT